MGNGVTKAANVLAEALRSRESPDKQAFLDHSVAAGHLDVWTQRSYDEKVPFVYAAELGLASIVFQLLDRDPAILDPTAKKGAKPERKVFSKPFLNGALLANCRGETDPELVARLMAEGAEPTYKDDYDNTPLHFAAEAPQDKAKDKFLWTQRSHAIKLLIDAGADLDAENESDETPLLRACVSHNEKGAFLIAAKGADLSCVEKWMTRVNRIGVEQKKQGKQNRSGEITWTGGSVLARFAFTSPNFLERLKKDFMKKFDADKNGYLDQKEMIRFLAYHVKMQFRAGLVPVVEFEDDGSLSIEQTEQLLKERCKGYLTSYLEMDKDADAKWEWGEIVYVVKDFYTNIWTKDRPAVVDDDRLEGSVSEQLIKEGAGADGAAGGDGAAGASSQYRDHDAHGKLPPNWYAIDSEYGVYYANSETNETSWERPGDASTYGGGLAALNYEGGALDAAVAAEYPEGGATAEGASAV